MVNRGFAILDDVVDHIDALIFENANDSRFNPSDKAWVSQICSQLKAHDVPVLLLDYLPHSDPDATAAMAKDFGWSYYLAPNVSLNSWLSYQIKGLGELLGHVERI